MPRSLIPFVLLCQALVGPAMAQDGGRFVIGDDVFLAGQTVAHGTAGTDDLFAAGQRIAVDADIDGSLHAIGQTISLAGATGGDVYAVGQDVFLDGGVAGDASLVGQTVRLSGDLGGDLRAAGSNVSILGPIGGTALLVGEVVRIDAPVSGDVALAAGRADFGTGARIAGTLTIFEDEIGATIVPPLVMPPERIERRELDQMDPEIMPRPLPTTGELITRFLGGVLVVALLAALIAALIPDRLAEMRRLFLDRPFRALWAGFLAQSALIGSTFLVAITLIGLILVPGILLIAGVAAVAGYVVGAYAFGVGLMLMAGRFEPDSLVERVVAAAIGALAVGLLGLIPFLGWIFVLALSLAGLGTIVQRLFRPTFYGPA